MLLEFRKGCVGDEFGTNFTGEGNCWKKNKLLQYFPKPLPAFLLQKL